MASFPTDNDKCPSSSLHRRRRLVLKPLWRPDHPTSHQYGPTGVDSLTPVHNHNLFVRLSPQTAQRLWYVATSKTKNGDAATNSIVTTTCQFEPNPQQLQNGSRSTTRNGGASSSLWTWMTDSLTAAAAAALPPPPGEIEFLPLKIITSNHGTVYASYNGGGIANQPNDEDANMYIGLSRYLFNDNCDDCIEEVSVQALTSVDTAVDLFVEPYDTHDWERIELDSTWLEHGGLLQQVSLVYSGQVLNLQLSQNGESITDDVVRLIVSPRNFEPQESGTQTWPNPPSPCLRLVADTRLVVSPKPKPSGKLDLILRMSLQDLDDDPSLVQLANQLNIDLVSVEQGTATIHPTVLAKLLIGNELTCCKKMMLATVMSGDNNRAIVKVVTSESLPDDSIILHRFIRLKVKCPLFSGHRVVSIQMLSPLEATNLSAVGMDVMERGRERLVLRPFVFNVANDLNQSWRSSPSNMIIKNRFISNSNAILNPLCESDLISFAETTTDFPVEFDGLITIPNERGENYCYQLTCVSQERNQGEQIQRSGLLFARELPSFLDFTSSKIVDCSDPMVLTANFHSCSTLPMLLPRETIFSQSLLTLAHTAMERSNAIVFGEQGSGKTCTALTLAATARLTHRCSTVYMDCTKLRDSRLIRMKDILSELTQLFDDAAASVPCVVVLDDLDVLTPTCDDRASVDASVQQHQMNPIEIDQSKLVTDVIVKLLRSLQQGISIIITCKFPEALPTCLPSMRLLSYKVAVPSFEEIDRERLYQSFLQRHCPTHVMASLHRIDFKRKTTGFRPRDLEQLAKRALQNWRLRSNSQFDVNEVTLGELVAFLPLSRLHTSPESSNNVAELSWSAIGGLSRAKTELTKTVVQPSRYRRIYEKSRIRLPRGILLYGFPGTGKTVCVPALAKECGFPLIMCRGPELLDKYIGASEAKVRDLFARAAASAPSILFIDELDSLAPRRGSDSTGVTDRIVNQLLTFLDGVEDNTAGGQVYVVATTSRPDKIDPALLRPGRFEKHVFFGYAEDNGEITDILTKISARYNLDTEASRAISSGDFVKSFQDESVKLGRLSPADFKSVFSSGQLMAAHEALSFGQTETNALIRLSHIFESFTSARPSLVQSDFEHLNDIYSSFGGRARASAGKGLKTEALRTALK